MLLLLACAAPSATPGSTSSPSSPPSPSSEPLAEATGETGADTAETTGDTAEPLPPLYGGDCAVDLTSASPLAFRSLLDEPSSYYFELPHLQPIARVFTDPQALAEWSAESGLPLDPGAVDFESELVVAGGYYRRNTCGLYLSTPLAWDVGGVPHVQIQVDDWSYGCIWECAHAQTALQVLAVPRGAAGTATVCVGVGGGCSVPAF
jgi:hypothetical protein